MNQTSHGQKTPQNSNKKVAAGWHLKTVFRGLVAIAVVVALAWTIKRAVADLQAQPISIAEIAWGKLIAAVLVYILTMLFSWSFWHRVLHALGQRPKWQRSLRAFLISQLGKYVPGKAMVVILRTDLVCDEQVKVAPAAASVFVETLTWIFVGAAIASMLIVFQFNEFRSLQIAALFMMLVSGIVTWPPCFNWIASKLTRGRTSGVTYGVDFSTMVFGWILLTAGWCINGFSLWLVVDSLPGTNLQIGHFPVVLAAVTLATVGGFVSLLPGGLGVRELVMIPLLGSQFGATNALIAAILIRFVWLTAEFSSSGIIYLVTRLTHEPDPKRTREDG